MLCMHRNLSTLDSMRSGHALMLMRQRIVSCVLFDLIYWTSFIVVLYHVMLCYFIYRTSSWITVVSVAQLCPIDIRIFERVETIKHIAPIGISALRIRPFTVTSTLPSHQYHTSYKQQHWLVLKLAGYRAYMPILQWLNGGGGEGG